MKLSDHQIEILLSANEAYQLEPFGSCDPDRGCAAQILYGIKDPSRAASRHPVLAQWFDNLFKAYPNRRCPTERFAKELVARFG